jgi:hypothetical protein
MSACKGGVLRWRTAEGKNNLTCPTVHVSFYFSPCSVLVNAFLSFFLSFFNLEHTYKIIVKRAILSMDDF